MRALRLEPPTHNQCGRLKRRTRLTSAGGYARSIGDRGPWHPARCARHRPRERRLRDLLRGDLDRRRAVWGDLSRDAENIARFSKRDADAYVEFDRYFDRVAGLLKDLLFVVPPNVRMRDVARWVRTAGRIRSWTGRDVHELVRLFTMSAADFLDEWFEDDRVKGALATQAISDPKVFGLDAAPPAAFLALLAPRLRAHEPLAIALAAAVIAILALPFVPAGVPLLIVAVSVALYGALRATR